MSRKEEQPRSWKVLEGSQIVSTLQKRSGGQHADIFPVHSLCEGLDGCEE